MVWRQQKRDKEFPKPDIYLNGRPHWEEVTLAKYDNVLRARAAEGRKFPIEGGDA